MYNLNQKTKKTTGALAPYLDVYLEVTRGLNVTHVSERTSGNLVDEATFRYDGCLGSLQMNESDTLVSGTSRYPSFGPHLYDGVVITAERLGVLSAYRQTDPDRDSRHTDVMEVFTSPDSAFWLLLLAFSLSAILVMYVTIKLFYPPTSRLLAKCVLWWTSILFASLLRQRGTSPRRLSKLTTMSAVLLVVAVAVLLLPFHLTSMMQTTMVVYERPITVESFAQLRDSGRRPLWFSLFADSDEFRLAPPGSIKRWLWDRAVGDEKGVKESMVLPDESAVMHGFSVGHQKEALLIHELKADVVLRFACVYSRSHREMMDVNGMFKAEKDTSDRKISLTTNSLTPADIVRHMSRRAQFISEAHLFEGCMRRIEFKDVAGLEHPVPESPRIDACTDGVIRPVEPDLRPVPPIHLKGLLVMCVIGMSLAAAVWVMEGLFWCLRFKGRRNGAKRSNRIAARA